MSTLVRLLEGKKTYLIALGLGAIQAARYLGYIDEHLADIATKTLIGGGLATLRSALSKVY